MSLPPWLYPLIKPTNPTEFWTMAMTVLTLGLIVVAWRGLHSLQLAKADMLTRSQREARACAIARCEEMAGEIIEKNGELITRFAELELPVFVDSPDVVLFDPDTSAHLNRAQTWLAQVPPELRSDCITQMNRLEAWSMYFTNGVADHSIAFGPCAPVFCGMVVRYYPFLLVRRAGHSSGKFPNTVKLFKSWRSQIEAQTDGVKMQELVQKLSTLQALRKKNDPQLPPPLGTG